MGRVLYAGDAIFDAFVQEWLNTPINLLLALYLVYPRYLFNMGPAYMFSRGVETLRIDDYLTLVLLTQGSPKCENLFIQVCCRAEDVAGGVYPNAKSIPDGRGAKSRNSVVHVRLISVLDGTAVNWCRQEELRARMSDTVLFGKVKDPDLMVFNFRGQLQCRMGGNVRVPSSLTPSSGT